MSWFKISFGNNPGGSEEVNDKQVTPGLFQRFTEQVFTQQPGAADFMGQVPGVEEDDVEEKKLVVLDPKNGDVDKSRLIKWVLYSSIERSLGIFITKNGAVNLLPITSTGTAQNNLKKIRAAYVELCTNGKISWSNTYFKPSTEWVISNYPYDIYCPYEVGRVAIIYKTLMNAKEPAREIQKEWIQEFLDVAASPTAMGLLFALITIKTFYPTMDQLIDILRDERSRKDYENVFETYINTVAVQYASEYYHGTDLDKVIVTKPAPHTYDKYFTLQKGALEFALKIKEWIAEYDLFAVGPGAFNKRRRLAIATISYVSQHTNDQGKEWIDDKIKLSEEREKQVKEHKVEVADSIREHANDGVPNTLWASGYANQGFPDVKKDPAIVIYGGKNDEQTKYDFKVALAANRLIARAARFQDTIVEWFPSANRMMLEAVNVVSAAQPQRLTEPEITKALLEQLPPGKVAIKQDYVLLLYDPEKKTGVVDEAYNDIEKGFVPFSETSLGTPINDVTYKVSKDQNISKGPKPEPSPAVQAVMNILQPGSSVVKNKERVDMPAPVVIAATATGTPIRYHQQATATTVEYFLGKQNVSEVQWIAAGGVKVNPSPNPKAMNYVVVYDKEGNPSTVKYASRVNGQSKYRTAKCSEGVKYGKDINGRTFAYIGKQRVPVDAANLCTDSNELSSGATVTKNVTGEKSLDGWVLDSKSGAKAKQVESKDGVLRVQSVNRAGRRRTITCDDLKTTVDVNGTTRYYADGKQISATVYQMCQGVKSGSTTGNVSTGNVSTGNVTPVVPIGELSASLPEKTVQYTNTKGQKSKIECGNKVIGTDIRGREYRTIGGIRVTEEVFNQCPGPVTDKRTGV